MSFLAIVITSWGIRGNAHLQHMQQGRLARIVETKEQQFGMFVQKTERGQDIVDCSTPSASARLISP